MGKKIAGKGGEEEIGWEGRSWRKSREIKGKGRLTNQANYCLIHFYKRFQRK